MSSSQVIIEEFHSRALEGNPLGDPITRRVPVYLPLSYHSKQRYPTLYLLAAFGNRGLKFLNDDLWEENIQQRLDRLTNEGRIRPMIVVMPDASTRYGGSQYINSTATGNYEDHILELVRYIDGKYPTIAEAAHRAAAGHSSGGFAALRFGMLHPAIFGLVADHSGDKCFELTYKPFIGDLLRYFERAGEGSLEGLVRNPGEALRLGAAHEALNQLAMASVYSPNQNTHLGFDLPFDLHTGALRPDVWARWLAFDPLEIVEQHAQSLKSLRLLYLDCGRFDEYNLLYGARLFTKKLSALGIPFRYEEYDGSHRYMRHRYDVSFSAISAAMPT
ncbi:MAG: alpha/beta hydrolase-fold protein [Chloroflexi bacterium]|nr:alpha/beta hydrolase-fold protein [Chloroflexota bacterium]